MSDRDQYIEKMKARLDEWNADLAKLEAQAKSAEADMRMQYDRHIEELRRQRDQAEKQLRELRDAGEESWERIRKSMEAAWDDMSRAFRDAADRFR
ncbi:conserved coiled coil protein [Thioalkalivibrio denitrificans]|uniref:Conserved coiled coil protein n=1 Tax=Thioalkalivibrio denitrificans TaxID=108003 RepID=A0A1V3N7Y7_9GAMM|nr:conserved coiled coil protein [Thioalkalivibrio denitrificans]OOG21008.1 conserved coiled coil protein [Thioalkalivibrio denitrificans]